MAITTDSELTALLSDWTDIGRQKDLTLGSSVDEAMDLGLALQRQVEAGEAWFIDINDQDSAADVIYAFARVMLATCPTAPEKVLREAAAVREVLATAGWPADELGEQDALLCSLAFHCWRAARLLGRFPEAALWEAEYKRVFRMSIHWEVADAVWSEEKYWKSATASDLDEGRVETLFQVVLYLYDVVERRPRFAAQASAALYRRVEQISLPNDLRLFFLGAAALLAGTTSRAVGSYHEAIAWIETAETHFRGDSRPEPQLARSLLQRLTVLYSLSQIQTVIRIAPILERTFVGFGMLEDRIKCRIVWAASLKLAGCVDDALDVLADFSRGGIQVGSRLYGWVLAEMGDLHGLRGEYDVAVRTLREAAALLRQDGQLTGHAHVSLMLGGIYRSAGLLRDAVVLFESTAENYSSLGMQSQEAYTRIVLAETYLALNLPAEAEKQVLTALPVFEDEGMLTDAAAALALLRDARRRRLASTGFLKTLRDNPQGFRRS